MLGVFIGGTETVPKIVAHGLWELSRRPDQLAAVRADLDANVPVAREEMHPLLRARTVVRPHRAQAVHDSRHHDQARASGSSRCWHRPTATSASTPIPTSSSGTGRSSVCWPSAAGSTSASACTWPAWRSRSWCTEWLKRVPDFRDRHRGGVTAAVEFPVGLEQHPGGGLTVWSYRLVAPVHLRADRRLPSSRRNRLGDGQVLLRFLAAGICGSDLPGFRGTKGKLPGDTGACAAEMDGFPIHEIVGEVHRQPPPRPPRRATASSAGRRASTA